MSPFDALVNFWEGLTPPLREMLFCKIEVALEMNHTAHEMEGVLLALKTEATGNVEERISKILLSKKLLLGVTRLEDYINLANKQKQLWRIVSVCGVIDLCLSDAFVAQYAPIVEGVNQDRIARLIPSRLHAPMVLASNIWRHLRQTSLSVGSIALYQEGLSQ